MRKNQICLAYYIYYYNQYKIYKISAKNGERKWKK